MTKLPLISSKELIAILEKEGFQKGDAGRGSHQDYIRENIAGEPTIVTVVIGKKELPQGTLLACLRRAGISRERFFELYRRKR